MASSRACSPTAWTRCASGWRSSSRPIHQTVLLQPNVTWAVSTVLASFPSGRGTRCSSPMTPTQRFAPPRATRARGAARCWCKRAFRHSMSATARTSSRPWRADSRRDAPRDRRPHHVPDRNSGRPVRGRRALPGQRHRRAHRRSTRTGDAQPRRPRDRRGLLHRQLPQMVLRPVGLGVPRRGTAVAGGIAVGCARIGGASGVSHRPGVVGHRRHSALLATPYALDTLCEVGVEACWNATPRWSTRALRSSLRPSDSRPPHRARSP